MNDSNYISRRKVCIVGFCESYATTQGYCPKHWQQMRTVGEIDDRYEMFRDVPLSIAQCEVCVNIIVDKRSLISKRRFCSRDCRNIQSSIDQGGDGTLSTRWRSCLACGESFKRKKRKNDAALYCSRECGYVVVSYTPEQRRIADKVIGERSALWRISKNIKMHSFKKIVKPEIDALRRIRKYRLEATKVIGVCECGCKFLRMRHDHKYGGSYEYCNQCRERRRLKATRRHRRTAKAVRRARMASAGVIDRIDPIEVLDAFKWRCYICGVSTPNKLRGTYDDRAPEVDHIVPLSKGGNHTFENLACACRKCNAEKSDSMPFLL